MNYFDRCTALITGASSGLGREFALQLAPHAHALVLVARRLDRLHALREEIARLHPQVSVFCYGLDLADEARIDDFFRWLDECDLRVDFLVNNAGMGDHVFFDESDWEKTRRVLGVNIVALTKITHRLLPRMLAMPRAAILNVSSIVSLVPTPNMAVYSATKAFVTSLTECLRVELRGTRVRVAALCPGPVDTEFRSVAERESKQPLPAPEILKVTAQRAVHAGLRAIATNRARVIPGPLLPLLIGIACTIPMFVLRFFLHTEMQRRGGSGTRSDTRGEPAAKSVR
jgi:uncharacterized protein